MNKLIKQKKKIKGGESKCTRIPNHRYPDYVIDKLNFLGNNKDNDFNEIFIMILMKILSIFDNRHDFKPGRSVLLPAEIKAILNPKIVALKNKISYYHDKEKKLSSYEYNLLLKLLKIYEKCPLSKEVEEQVLNFIYQDILISSKLPTKIYNNETDQNDATIFDNQIIFEHEYDLIKACNYNCQIRLENGKKYVYPVSKTDGSKNTLLANIKQKIANDIGIIAPKENRAEYIDTRIKFCIDVSSIGKWVFQNNKDSISIVESIFDDYDHFKKQFDRHQIENDTVQLCDGNIQLNVFKVVDDDNNLQWIDNNFYPESLPTLQSKIMLSPEGDIAGVNKFSQAITSVIRNILTPSARDSYELIKKIFYSDIISIPNSEQLIQNNFSERCMDFKRIMDMGKLAFTMYKNRRFQKSDDKSEYVVLVTHDRMLYAIALCLRCPVIYVNIGSHEKAVKREIFADLDFKDIKKTEKHTIISHPRKLEIRLPIEPNYKPIYENLKKLIENIYQSFKGFTNEYNDIQINTDIIQLYQHLKIFNYNTIPDTNSRKQYLNWCINNGIILLYNYIYYAISYINNLFKNIINITNELELILSIDVTEESYTPSGINNLKTQLEILKNRYNINYNYVNVEQINQEVRNIHTLIKNYNSFIVDVNKEFENESENYKDEYVLTNYITRDPNIHNRIINIFKKNFNIKEYKILYHINHIGLFNEYMNSCNLRRNDLIKISNESYIRNLEKIYSYIEDVLKDSIEGGGQKRPRDSTPLFAPATPPHTQERKYIKKLRTDTVRVEDIYSSLFNFNIIDKFSMHLLNFTIEKGLERFKYITDDNITTIDEYNESNIIEITYMMLYKAFLYHLNAFNYANQIINMEISETSDLCFKLEENINTRDKMIDKIINITHIDFNNSIISNILDPTSNINTLIETAFNSSYCFDKFPIKGGFKNKNRFNFYKSFVKTLKRTI